MKRIYSAILFIWLAVEIISGTDFSLFSIASLLGALCFFIIKEKYFDKASVSILYYIAVVALSLFDGRFIILSGIPVLDFFYTGRYVFAVPAFAAAVVFIIQSGADYRDIFFIAAAALFGYITGAKDRDDKKHISVLDQERRLRYQLEQIRNELLNSRKEVEHLAEIRERNRIAHEIHDNIGHGIAGVIFQLDAAVRILHTDPEKSVNNLKLCRQKLAEVLELTRSTVYNIRVDRKIGLDSLKKIIDDYRFCKLTFEHSGDFSMVSASVQKILEANIMESLTNTSKHSDAENVMIKLDIGTKNIRLYYKDDGKGCGKIHESLLLAFVGILSDLCPLWVGG